MLGSAFCCAEDDDDVSWATLPRSSARQTTHSRGGVPGTSRALQSREFALQTSLSTSTQIHQRLRTSFCPLCLGSSTASVMICFVQRPRSILMNSRCLVSGLKRTGPVAIRRAGCFEASAGTQRCSNSMYSPAQMTDSPSWSRTSTPTWTCSGSVWSCTIRSDSSEL